jgi:hypothetical protein
VSAACYEIAVRGRLGAGLAHSIEGFEVVSAGAEGTRLRGWVVDQAALQGVLTRLHDVSLELLEVRRVCTDASDPRRLGA